MNNFWTSDPGAFSSIANESRKLIVHPQITELIKQGEGVKVLDYGCGDGSLITLLHPDCEISLFDISDVILQQAANNLKKYKPKIYYNKAEIPDNHFDYVIFSLVLMTIPTREEIKETLAKIRSALNENGIAIIAITHPCFRREIFSTFRTDYSGNKDFNYFKEGDRFEVFVSDGETGKFTSFNDYHWPLDATFKLIAESGLIMRSFIELPDKAGAGKYFNPSFSPYILMECGKK